MPDAAGLLTPSGSPLSTITIENPDRTLATTGQLRMTSIVDGHSEVVDYYHRPQDNEWEMVKDGGFYHEIIKTESNNLQDPVGGNPLPRMVRLRKTFNLINNAIHTISETRETYERLACGTRLISRVEDPDGVARETTWTWGVTGTTTTDPTFGRNIKINRPDGSWTRYGYDQYGRGVKQASGIGNQPDNTPDADCRVVEHVINPVGAPSWTRLEVERRAGIEVSRRYIREYNDGYDQIVCLTQGAAWDAADNLVTKVRYHTTGLFAGLIKSRQSPEGLLSLTSYTASPSSATTQVALNEFTTVTHTGVPNSGGTAIVEGTTVTTVTNRQGRVIQEAEHDFVTGHLLRQTLATQVDSRGRALERLHLDGRTDSVVYDCCGIASETDRNNVTRTYTDVESEGLTSQVTLGITETKAKLGGRQIWTRLGTDDSLFEINRSQRNLAGEVTSSYTLADGQSSQVLTHPVGGGTELTTTFSDDGTKVISLWADGSVKSVTGTAVAPRRFERGVETNGLVWVKEIALDELGADTSEWAMLWTDLAGRTVKTQKSGSEAATRHYNVTGQLVKEIDPDGVIVLHEKDTLGRLSTVCLDMNRNGIIDFNGSDMVLQTTRAFATRGGARVVERATEKAWAEFNDPTASTMRVVERAVDGLDSWVETGGLITHTQKQHLAGNGNWTVTTTYPDDSKTVVTYANGRLFKVEDKDSADVVLDSVTHVYDAHGRLHSKTDGKGAQSVFAYRTADNPEVGGPLVTSDQLASVQSPPVGSSETTPVSLFGYDVRGRRNLLTDPLNGTVQTNFYHTGLVSQVSGTRAYPVSYTYTAQGRLSSMTTATGVTQWDYHAESGWPWRKWIDSALASTLTYTDAGRLLTKANGRGTVITHSRDNGGRVTSVDYADTTPDVAFTYDRLGRVLTAALAGGGTATMNRHLLGQMEAEAWTGGSLGGLSVNHGYDTLRRRQTLAVSLDSAPVSQQTFGYDAGSRFESVVFEGHTATYERDENASHITGLNYGVSGSPGMTNTVSRDVAGRIESLSYTVGASVLRSHEYEMDDMGRRLREEAESGDGKSWLYNDRGEISQASHEFADETAKPLEQFSYLYDGIGNRTSATVAGRVQAYTPDDQNRYLNRSVPPYYHLRGEADEDAGILVNQQTVSRHGRAFWKELSFDNASSALFGGIRIVAAKPGAGPGGADLVAVENRTAYLAPATESFLYDADGNLTEDARRTYEWDAENRLIRVTDKAGAVEPPDPPFAAPSRKRVSHEYDTASRRVRKLVEEWDAGSSSWQAEGDVRYVYDGWNVIAELEATGSGLEMRRSHAWGLDVSGTPQGAGGVGGLLFTAHHESGSGTTVHTVCYDGNGNVTALANAATGTLTAYYDYDAFGTTLRATGAAAASNGYRFSTKPVDEETGLVYYGYRWYHPELGRWLSRDPIGEAGGLNLYGMVGNDPVNGVDVLGLEVAGYHSWRRHADALTDGSPSRDGQTPNVSVKDKCGRDWVYVAEHDFWIRLGLSSALQDKCCGPDDLIKGPRYGLDAAGDEGLPNQDDRSSTRQRADELQRLAEELSGRNPLVEAREQIPEVLAKTGSEMMEIAEAGGNMTLIGSLRTIGLRATRTLTGQIHHPISTKVGRAVDNHPLLRDAFAKRDPRFVTQAADEVAHRGYQRWHRDLDDEVVEWIQSNPDTTPDDFLTYLRELYKRPDLIERFPNGF